MTLMERLLDAVRGHEDDMHEAGYTRGPDDGLRLAIDRAETVEDAMEAIAAHRRMIGDYAIGADETLWAELDEVATS